MNRFLRRGVAILATAMMAFSAVGCNSDDSKSSGKAEWNELSQTEITKAMGLGWNLGNQLEANNAGFPEETAWGNPEITEELILKNHLKEARSEKDLSQAQLAEMVGVSRNTISSIETGQFNPTAKLALVLCIALDKKFEELFYFE